MSVLFVLEVLLANVAARALALGCAFWMIARPLAAHAQSLLAAAAGFLLAMSVTHLLPEAFESGAAEPHDLGIVIFATLAVFIAASRLFGGLHAHGGARGAQAPGLAALFFAAALHSFVDGILVAAAFLASTSAGWLAAFAVLAHEVPQQAGFFVILKTAGKSRLESLLFCSGASLFAAAGAGAGLAAISAFSGLMPYALAMSAASFLYIAAFVLIPEVFEEAQDLRGNLSRLLLIAAGAALSFVTLGVTHDFAHEHDHGYAHVHEEADAAGSGQQELPGGPREK